MSVSRPQESLTLHRPGGRTAHLHVLAAHRPSGGRTRAPSCSGATCTTWAAIRACTWPCSRARTGWCPSTRGSASTPWARVLWAHSPLGDAVLPAGPRLPTQAHRLLNWPPPGSPRTGARGVGRQAGGSYPVPLSPSLPCCRSAQLSLKGDSDSQRVLGWGVGVK